MSSNTSRVADLPTSSPEQFFNKPFFRFPLIVKTCAGDEVADLHFSLKFVVSYDTNQLLSIKSKDVEKINHFLNWFVLGHLLGLSLLL